ncbi:hypothetical protein [Sinomonas gamaensis]|uniref:hypothetical protein n=1 Tax=Sinomonas gamaensis TaxID=2565624 RepID=UPI001486466A|nr:hypothetical protein [Sinomonas gamaensis]
MMFDAYPGQFDHKTALGSLASVATTERKAAIVDELIELLPEKLTDMEDLQMADFLLRCLGSAEEHSVTESPQRVTDPEQGDPS